LKDVDPLSLFTWEPGAGAGEPGASYILSYGSREPRSREPAIKIDGSETLVINMKRISYYSQLVNSSSTSLRNKKVYFMRAYALLIKAY
jgi:hypothetical protein